MHAEDFRTPSFKKISSEISTRNLVLDEWTCCKTMAKRAYQELVEVEQPTKVLKKVKKSKSNDVPAGETKSTAVELPSKAERKQAKHVKKQAAELKHGGEEQAESRSAAEIELVAKADRKARKKADRRAEKDAKSEVHIATASTEAKGGKPAYREHPSLSSLPQSEIDAFIAETELAVEDSLQQPYRPITSFEYLSLEGESQRTPFASFSAPTPIQAACWPYLFAGRDVVGVAETGSGKTLAFGLPCVRKISQLEKKDRKCVKACVVSPTRELAMQIHEQLSKLAEPAKLKSTCVYGGVSKDEQRKTLKGSSIVVATPGRLNDFLQEGSIDLSYADFLVLDEADRMLDKGFEEEVRKIISSTASTGRQTLMFTATWPLSVRELASTFMRNPVKVTIGGNASGELRANMRIIQEVEVMDEYDKQTRLLQLLKQYQSGKNKTDRILVFCLYKKEATRIEEFIRRNKFPVAGIHGDLSQQRRTESMDAFKKGQVPLLVATDVAARGLDIPAVKVVINVTFPLTVEDYVHRIGR